MKKILVWGVILVLAIGFIFAAKKDRRYSLPKNAKEVSKGVYKLEDRFINGRLLEGYAFVRYKEDKHYGKPGVVCGNDVCEVGENANKCPQDCGGGEDPLPDSSCYEFMAKGAKWREYENWVVNPINSEGLDHNMIFQNIGMDIDKWEDAATGSVDGNILNLFGTGQISYSTDVSDTETYDNINGVYFADVDSPGAIAVTIVWGYFSGPPKFRELVEWDQIYDDYDFDWSLTGAADKMDFENIATHELGHSFGLGDLYEISCSQETMYGYGTEGETYKRSLNTGDITGIYKLYN